MRARKVSANDGARAVSGANRARAAADPRQRRSRDGLANHGWKDSYDSVFHADGTLAEGPIALVEVQGYAYGARLAGGQRQRLAVARAHVARFPVMILDEPAEHLDHVTANALVADLVAGAPEATTVVLITHRLCGLDSMDEIVVLDAGRVVARGTHDEIVAAHAPTRELTGAVAT